jgi:hypothetical protein
MGGTIPQGPVVAVPLWWGSSEAEGRWFVLPGVFSRSGVKRPSSGGMGGVRSKRNGLAGDEAVNG